MSTSAQFASAPKVGSVNLTVANALRDGTGTVGTVFTAGTNGSRIHAVKIKALATTTTGTIRLFLFDGTNYRLLTEKVIDAVTPTATLPSYEALLSVDTGILDFPLYLPFGYSLRASTEKSESFNVIAIGGDF